MGLYTWLGGMTEVGLRQHPNGARETLEDHKAGQPPVELTILPTYIAG